MLAVGLLLAPLIGWWLITRRRADLPLSLLGLTSLPVLVWAGSLGAKIGPCDVPSCMSSAEHSRLVLALVALGILLVVLGLLGAHQPLAGGAALIVADVLGAFSIARTDTAILVMLIIFAAAAVGYLVSVYVARREALRVPDYPPVP
jgi:hypothetical protein